MAARTSVLRRQPDLPHSKAEAVRAVRDVGDSVTDAIDKSLQRRPYTTLLMAVGLGFLLGAVWTR